MNGDLRYWFAAGAVSLAVAVGAGAFGAHALKGQLDPYSTDVYEKAVFYLFIHGLGILVIALCGRLGVVTSVESVRCAALMLFGNVVFSGSLLILALTGIRWLGAITPFGGSAYILSWILLAWYCFRATDT